MSTSEPPPMEWELVFPGDDIEVGPRVTELRRLASATRRMIEELMSTSASIDAVAEAAELVERAVELLAGHPHDRAEDHVSESAVAGDPGSFLEFSPLIGRSNPIAPPLELALVDGRVVGTGVFGSAYEGPPGHVHGGHIAAAFDEVLGMVQSTTKKPGMTGLLSVRYRSPTPLHEVLDGLMAGPLGRSDWPLAYWSKARLFSVDARRNWLEPDLKPFQPDQAL